MSLMRNVLLAGSQSIWLRERATRYPFVRRSVSRFMPGETVEDAIDATRQLGAANIGTILTRLGENITSAAEADEVREHYLQVLEKIRAGNLRTVISIKPTQLGLDIDEEMCFQNLRTLVERAAALNNFVWVDMESSPYVDRTLALYRRVRAGSPAIGVCLQSYLFRSEKDLEALLPLGPAIRVVKGAYKEPPDVAFPKKSDVDENFYKMCVRLLAARSSGSFLGIGTHDVALVERLRAHIAASTIPDTAYEYEMLYGIQRPLQQQLASGGKAVRVLISYGEYWFPWYMRRLAERPANVMFVLKNMVGG
jgi:proline dehydrogenase